MSKFTYFEGLKPACLLIEYLILLNKAAAFSGLFLLGPNVQFLGYLEAYFGSKTLETRSPLHYTLKLKISALHFKLACGEVQTICSVSSSVPEEIPSQTLHFKLNLWRGSEPSAVASSVPEEIPGCSAEFEKLKKPENRIIK